MSDTIDNIDTTDIIYTIDMIKNYLLLSLLSLREFILTTGKAFIVSETSRSGDAHFRLSDEVTF